MAESFPVVKAVPGALSGAIITGRASSTGPNQWVGISSTKTRIRAVAIRANAGNTGDIYIGGAGCNSANTFILGKGESISLAVDDLVTIKVFIPTSGDGYSYLAIGD